MSRAICIYLMLTVVIIEGRFILNYLPFSDMFYTYIRFCGSFLAVLLCLKYLKNSELLILVLLETFFGISYLYAWLSGFLLPENILPYTIITLLLCIPYLVFLYAIGDLNCLYSKILSTSYFMGVVLTLHYFNRNHLVEYDMAFSYLVLLCAIIQTNEVFRRDGCRFLNTLFVLFELTMIVVYGARGPLFCYGIFILLKAIFGIDDKKVRRIVVLFGIVLVIFTGNYRFFATSLNNYLVNQGMGSRTLKTILSETIFNDSGRLMIQKNAMELIRDRSILGYGASGELGLINNSYPHNLYLELLIDFGVIIGGLLAIYVTFIVIKSIIMHSSIYKDLGFIFLTLGFVMLQFSGTYLQNIYIFMFVGLMMRKQDIESRIKIV